MQLWYLLTILQTHIKNHTVHPSSLSFIDVNECLRCCELMRKLALAFKFQMLPILGRVLVLSVVALYRVSFMMKTINRLEQSMLLVQRILILIEETMMIFILVVSCDESKNKVEQFYHNCLRASTFCKGIGKTEQLKVCLWAKENVAFTGARFFKIGRPTIISMGANIMTYIALLLQYGSDDRGVFNL
ncbi:Hypothetical protein NTJ_10092 [Nesidiocoris tenuis]|uniref:Gustatory receptor n=1 Tax=Nesidiocoris tenuis TaxID=355587 RepID=A0ABN7AZ63_9HEMI|nr:Hypothetical protein NTJ_10092 [Nesidiocoris tenuis]